MTTTSRPFPSNLLVLANTEYLFGSCPDGNSMLSRVCTFDCGNLARIHLMVSGIIGVEFSSSGELASIDKLSSTLRFHDTRASFCSYLAQLGVHVLDIKQLAGHEDIQTTMKYINSGNRNLRDAVKLLAEKRSLEVKTP